MGLTDYERYLEQLRRHRAPAMARAARLIDDGRFDDADRAVTSVDDSIYGAVALAGLYKAVLEGSRGTRRTEWREQVFAKALWWADSAFPEPHTAVEAEHYDAARAEHRAELVHLLGHEPRQHAAAHEGATP